MFTQANMFTQTTGPWQVDYNGVVNRFSTFEEAKQWAETFVVKGDGFYINGEPYYIAE